MSKKNGDRARFGKEQKKKLLRREQNLKLRRALDTTKTEPTVKPATVSSEQTTARTIE